MPGWNVQSSCLASSGLGKSLEDLPHARRLHVVFSGIGVEGSSESSSISEGAGDFDGASPG